MPGKIVCIHTLDKLVLSASAATAGTHASLDFIPGSALLGAVASRLYAALPDPDTQWAVFHSGLLRFGNAYPATRGAPSLSDSQADAKPEQLCYFPTWPVPLALHAQKQNEAFVGDKMMEKHVVDLSAGPVPEKDKQYKPQRTGYLDHSRRRATTQSDYQLKTAIDYQTGAASTGQLFGYNTLAADQVFIGELSWDAAFEQDYPEVLAEVLDVLENQPLRLGRAKSAEFGKVHIRLFDEGVSEQEVSELSGPDKASSTQNQDKSEDKNKFIRLLCISDVALKDQYGQATLQLTPRHLGLEETELKIIPARCFVRSSQYVVYNAHHRSYDQQRAVIAKGSVFTFEVLADIVSIKKRLAHTLTGGIGLFTEAGLGQLRQQFYIPGSDGVDLNTADSSLSEVKNSSLLTWLEGRAGKHYQQQWANKTAMPLLQELRECYKQSRLLQAVPPSEPCGPNKHNWSEILTRAKQAPTNDELMLELFGGDKPLVRLSPFAKSLEKDSDKLKTGDNWQVPVIDKKGSYISMANWLKQELQNIITVKGDEPEVSLHMVMQILARQAMSENIGAGDAT